MFQEVEKEYLRLPQHAHRTTRIQAFIFLSFEPAGQQSSQKIMASIEGIQGYNHSYSEGVGQNSILGWFTGDDFFCLTLAC